MDLRKLQNRASSLQSRVFCWRTQRSARRTSESARRTRLSARRTHESARRTRRSARRTHRSAGRTQRSARRTHESAGRTRLSAQLTGSSADGFQGVRRVGDRGTRTARTPSPSPATTACRRLRRLGNEPGRRHPEPGRRSAGRPNLLNLVDRHVASRPTVLD